VKLTVLERDALLAVASGQTRTDAASQLGVSYRTLHRVLDRVTVKLGGSNMMNAVAIAASSGIITVLPERKPPCYDGSPAGTAGRWNEVRNTRADDQLARRNGL
jgi:DNA-binding CsgD family transcriptional regulator